MTLFLFLIGMVLGSAAMAAVLYVRSKKKQVAAPPAGPAPKLEYSLKDMLAGFMVDYDLETYEVAAKRVYDYEGWPSTEWELTGIDGTRLFLEYEDDDGDRWTLSKRVRAVPHDFAEQFDTESDDWPRQIVYNNTTFRLKDDGEASIVKVNDKHEHTPFFYAVYGNDKEDFDLIVEDFNNLELLKSWNVKEFEFDDILPAPPKESY